MQSTHSHILVYIVAGIVVVGLIVAFFVYRSDVPAPSDLPLSGQSTTTVATSTATTTTPAKQPEVTTPAPDNTAAVKAGMALGEAKYRAGDYAGARDQWGYVSRTWPTNNFSFVSLAQLYEQQYMDYASAEKNYLAAIQNAPAVYASALYRDLFNVYANFYKQNAGNAESTLKAGIAANPKAIDLSILLAQYYRDHGRTAEAKAQYDLAIAAAKAAGSTSLVATLETEKSSF